MYSGELLNTFVIFSVCFLDVQSQKPSIIFKLSSFWCSWWLRLSSTGDHLGFPKRSIAPLTLIRRSREGFCVRKHSRL